MPDDKKLLEMFPFQNCEFEEKDNLVILKYKQKNPSFIERIFFRKQLDRIAKVDLDEIGTFVWHLCDGKISVNDIVVKLKEHFGEKVDPAEDRTLKFIKQLAGNKFITLYQKQ